MYRVIIVDDEPTAIRHITMILEKYGKEFNVIGTAENGLEAIDLIKETSCDLLITDIRMPVMNGIELIEWIAGEGLKLNVIVTSGYQEFEYVQQAINLGASSYLLKPVIPNQMASMLNKVKSVLEKNYLQEQKKLVSAICAKEACDEVLLRRVFPNNRYCLAVKRIKGLPTRYRIGGALETYTELNNSTVIFGRDLYEELFFIPITDLNGQDIINYVRRNSNLNGEHGGETIVYFSEPMKVEEFVAKVAELYRGLDGAIIIGKDQVLTVQGALEMKASHSSDLLGEDLKFIQYYIQEKRMDAIKEELGRLFIKWQDEDYSQLYIESQTKQILYRIRADFENELSLLETEYLIEEIFTHAKDVNELRANYWELLLKITQKEERNVKIDTPQFLSKITEYIHNHIDQQIPLRDICNRFGVSQPYLSKMFRKYMNESFNHYVTQMRIDRAKYVMTQHPCMKVKDIAAMVGYEDQFYFSRIFRSYTDVTPTEFMSSLGGLVCKSES